MIPERRSSTRRRYMCRVHSGTRSQAFRDWQAKLRRLKRRCRRQARTCAPMDGIALNRLEQRGAGQNENSGGAYDFIAEEWADEHERNNRLDQNGDAAKDQQ